MNTPASPYSPLPEDGSWTEKQDDQLRQRQFHQEKLLQGHAQRDPSKAAHKERLRIGSQVKAEKVSAHIQAGVTRFLGKCADIDRVFSDETMDDDGLKSDIERTREDLETQKDHIQTSRLNDDEKEAHLQALRSVGVRLSQYLEILETRLAASHTIDQFFTPFHGLGRSQANDMISESNALAKNLEKFAQNATLKDLVSQLFRIKHGVSEIYGDGSAGTCLHHEAAANKNGQRTDYEQGYLSPNSHYTKVLEIYCQIETVLTPGRLSMSDTILAQKRYHQLYPFQNRIQVSNRGGSIFLYVTKAIWRLGSFWGGYISGSVSFFKTQRG